MNAPRSADLAALAVELADAVDEVWVEGDSWDITALREAQVKVRAAASAAVPDTGHPGADDMWTAREVEIMTDSLRLTVRRTARMLLDALNEQERLEAALASAAPPGDTGQARELEHPAGCPSCSGMLADRDCDDRRPARALLGTDTTPDRLAWISEAGETAAAERQARYQETACARRPAATSGDPAQPDLAYARSEVDKWLADNDPYCILPTRTEHIPALLARLDELEGTR